MTSRRVVIIAHGELKDFSFYRNLIRDNDLVICVNGGTRHALALGLSPDLVIGDLDSLRASDQEAVKQVKAKLIKHPSEKDKSDLELALDHAVGLQPSEILIIGALGGARFEHAFINVLLLKIPLGKDIPARIIEERQEILMAKKEAALSGAIGDYLSLFALTEEVRGITTEGLKYPLNNESLYYASSLGLSNEFTSSQVKVNFQSGLLLLVKTPRGDNDPG